MKEICYLCDEVNRQTRSTNNVVKKYSCPRCWSESLFIDGTLKEYKLYYSQYMIDFHDGKTFLHIMVSDIDCYSFCSKIILTLNIAPLQTFDKQSIIKYFNKIIKLDNFQ